jgi:hypothetical protein
MGHPVFLNPGEKYRTNSLVELDMGEGASLLLRSPIFRFGTSMTKSYIDGR